MNDIVYTSRYGIAPVSDMIHIGRREVKYDCGKTVRYKASSVSALLRRIDDHIDTCKDCKEAK